MVNQLLSLYQLYSKIVLIMAFFLIFGKNPLFLFIKKVTNRSLIIIDLFLFHQFVVKCLKNYYSTQYLNFFVIIIDLFLFHQFVVKCLKNYYSTQYLNFFVIIIFSVPISQDSDHQIPENINFFQ